VSGYLQRLAARAINPRGTVHPVVGSFFAPERPAAEPDRLLVEEDEQVIARPPASAPGAPMQAARGGSASAERPAHPVTPLVQPEDQTPAPAPRTAVHPAEVSQKEFQKETPPESEWTTARLPEQEAVRKSSSPPGAQAAPVFSPQLPPPLPLRPGRPPAPELRTQPPARREPEEIQIHIGRIEVTAVPAAPAAAPTARPRRAPNLAEYLKKGDRRPI